MGKFGFGMGYRYRGIMGDYDLFFLLCVSKSNGNEVSPVLLYNYKYHNLDQVTPNRIR